MYVTVVDAPVGKWLGMDALVCGLCWTPRFVALVIELEGLGHSFYLLFHYSFLFEPNKIKYGCFGFCKGSLLGKQCQLLLPTLMFLSV